MDFVYKVTTNKSSEHIMDHYLLLYCIFTQRFRLLKTKNKHIHNITGYFIGYILKKDRYISRRIHYFRIVDQNFSEICSDGDIAIELVCDCVLILPQRFKR